MTIRGYQLDCAPSSQEFAPFERIQADVPQKGATSLFVGSKMPPLGLCWLGSDTVMPGGGNFAPDGELVRIRMRRNGRIYFDRPLQRTWHGNAVIPIGVPILEDVVLDGGKGPIHVGLADRVTIRNWSVESYNEARGISVQGCRNVTIQNVSVSNPAQGYGIQLQRCTSAAINLCTGTGNRHLVALFGSSNCAVSNCVATGPAGTAFDAHFACGDILFEDCDFGLSDFSCGNKWEWANANVILSRAKNCKMAWIHGPSELEIRDTTLLGPVGLARTPYGSPKRVRLVDTSYRAYSTAESLYVKEPVDTVVEFVNSGPRVSLA